MNRTLAIILLGGALAYLPQHLAEAQTQPAPARQAPVLTVDFKDGRSAGVIGLRKEGNSIMATLPPAAGGVPVTIGYPISTVAKIEFPEPPQIKMATDLAASGRGEDAAKQIDPIVAFYEPFREIPGNWWLQAATVKLNVLILLQHFGEAEGLIAQITELSTNPEAVLAAKTQLAALWLRKGMLDKAQPIFETAISESKSADTLALAWLNKGNILLQKKQFEPALFAFLHVSVYYSNQRLFVPGALLGAARALKGLNEIAPAKRKLNNLMTDYASSPELAAAKQELEKLESPESKSSK